MAKKCKGCGTSAALYRDGRCRLCWGMSEARKLGMAYKDWALKRWEREHNIVEPPPVTHWKPKHVAMNYQPIWTCVVCGKELPHGKRTCSTECSKRLQYARQVIQQSGYTKKLEDFGITTPECEICGKPITGFIGSATCGDPLCKNEYIRERYKRRKYEAVAESG